MEVTCVEAEQLLSRHRISHVELVRPDRVGLGADAEEFGLDGVEVVRVEAFVGENPVQGVDETLARAEPVYRDVLESVRNPNIGHGGGAEVLTHGRPDLAARDPMLDPEVTDSFVRMG